MLISAYGTFWDRDGVDWNPGSGPNAWRLLGRLGANRPGLRIADFRPARGVYLLFDNHGAHYVGLARGAGGLGARLKQHLTDEHHDRWQRFCWFAFDGVVDEPSSRGVHQVHLWNQPYVLSAEEVIGDLEALLITVLGIRRQNQMRFQDAEEWTQVPWWDQETWLSKARAAT